MQRSRALNNTQILQAALIVLLGFVASGVLGLVRLAVISATFGASAELDSFYAAQRIPEALFVLVAGGALGSSFIPVFARFLNNDDDKDAWRLASAVMSLAAASAGVLAALMMLLAPLLVPLILVPGSNPQEQALTTSLVQIMLLTTVIFAVSGLMMGILNAHQNFVFPALALGMNSIGIIIGALVFAPIFANGAHLVTLLDVEADYSSLLYAPISLERNVSGANIYGLAWGAVLGALLHLLIQIPGLWKIRARLWILLNWHVPGVREVLFLMGPRVLGLAVVQINFIINVAFASDMVDGSQTALTTAWTLMFFVLGIVAQSVGTAVFPTLSALVAENDMGAYRNRLADVMRGMLFMAFPATIGLMIISAPLITVMFERGEWVREDTLATAWALSFFALGIAGHSLLEVLSRAFYALADTWTPVRIGIAAMVANIILSVILIRIIGEPGSLQRGPFAGLALANSLTTLLEACVLWWLLKRRIDGINDRYILEGVAKILVASLLMGLCVWLLDAQLLNDVHNFIRVGVSGAFGAIIFFGLALVLRIEESMILLRRLRIIRV